MNKPHKHCELIKAWADGATIEFFHPETRKWVVDHMPTWSLIVIYRIKPEPKKMYVRLYANKSTGAMFCCNPSPIKGKETDMPDYLSSQQRWVSDWIEVELYSEDE